MQIFDNAGLRRKIDAVQSDKNKVLNLLRGFFFWLQVSVLSSCFAIG